MRRLLAAVGVLAVLLALAISPPRDSLASWTRHSYEQATFTSLKVTAPVLGATCTLAPGTLGLNPVITVTWTLPSGYALTDIRYGYYNVNGLEVVTGGLLSSITTTGGPTAYTTKFGSGLLAGLLGGSKSVGVLTQHSSGWTSGWATVTASMGLAGSNPSCTVNAPPA